MLFLHHWIVPKIFLHFCPQYFSNSCVSATFFIWLQKLWYLACWSATLKEICLKEIYPPDSLDRVIQESYLKTKFIFNITGKLHIASYIFEMR